MSTKKTKVEAAAEDAVAEGAAAVEAAVKDVEAAAQDVEVAAKEVAAEAAETADAAIKETTEGAVAAKVAVEGAAAPKKKKKGKKLLVVLGVLALAFIAAGAGFWIWHEQPSFCSAICHTPMDPYGRTYEFSSGAPGEDKWGNEVPDAGAMMVVTHKEAGEDCMACHVPSLGEQITEGLTWITGNYEYPLNERNLKNLVEARGIPADEFCLNDRCHHVTADGAALQTRDDLFAMTDEYTRNPHKPQHGENECGLCHKAHRASVNYCSQCHGDAPIPDGWLTHMQAQKLDRP